MGLKAFAEFAASFLGREDKVGTVGAIQVSQPPMEGV